VREKLEEALRSGRKRRGSLAREFIDYIIQRVLTPQRLKEAIEGDLDLTELAFNHMHLSNPMVLPILKIFGRVYWREIEDYLSDAQRIYSILIEKPEYRSILDNPRARKYLNRQLEKLYNEFYRVIWL